MELSTKRWRNLPYFICKTAFFLTTAECSDPLKLSDKDFSVSKNKKKLANLTKDLRTSTF